MKKIVSITLLFTILSFGQTIKVDNVILKYEEDRLVLDLGRRMYTESSNHEFKVSIYKDNRLTMTLNNKEVLISEPLFSIKGSRYPMGHSYIYISSGQNKVIKDSEVFEIVSSPGEYILFVTEIINDKVINENNKSLIIK